MTKRTREWEREREDKGRERRCRNLRKVVIVGGRVRV